MIALLAAAPVALPSDPPAHATISTVDESICTRFPLEALPRIANPPFRKFVSDLSSEVLRQPQAAAVEAPLDAQHVALNKCPRIPLPSRTEAQLHQRQSATAGGGQAGGLDFALALANALRGLLVFSAISDGTKS